MLLTQEGRLHEFDLYQVPDIEEGLSNIARRHRRAERQQRREATEEAFIDEVSNEAERRFILIKDDDSLNTNGYLWYPMGQVPTMADPTTGRFALTHIEHRDTVTIDFRDWLPQAVATTLLP